MNAVEAKIKTFIDEALEGTTLFIVDFKLLPKNRIVLLLDGDNGIGIDEVAKVSKHVSHRMEEENVIEGAHTLEVSSPGVDYPLKFQRQYPQHIGRTLAVRMNDGKELEGKLLAINADIIDVNLEIKEKGKKARYEEQSISLTDIKEAKIKIIF
ncbi:MAG: ribosome assembly cofactor RimP [Sphingobacteriales bacterium]|jgi:ribosome maturation factor RimP|nr:ribosome assembly cofactor RimP [Sphingobacteriales bacterium]